MTRVAPETRHYPTELDVRVCGKGPQQGFQEQVKTEEPLGFSSATPGPSQAVVCLNVRTSAKLEAIPPG